MCANPEDDAEFEDFYQNGYSTSDHGQHRIRDVLSCEEARRVFDEMKRRARERDRQR